MFDYKITVFTPTYNRAYILENLYRSLQRQLFRDFEWVIVDDGSSDGTAALVSAWQAEENFFPIRYFYRENGGKCRGINFALKKARGELFFTVDSDDYLTGDALEKVARWEAELPKNGNFCGMVANRGDAPDHTPNTLFDGAYFDGNAFDLYGKIDGERALVFYTEIHRRYLYPEFPGEKFMTEAVTWNRMAHDGYRIRFFNDIIWIWEYKPDGLTKKGYSLFLNNPRGTGVWLREKADFLPCPWWKRVAMWYGYTCDAYPLCPKAQLAGDIGMPEFLVEPMWRLHRLSRFLRGKQSSAP